TYSGAEGRASPKPLPDSRQKQYSRSPRAAEASQKMAKLVRTVPSSGAVVQAGCCEPSFCLGHTEKLAGRTLDTKSGREEEGGLEGEPQTPSTFKRNCHMVIHDPDTEFEVYKRVYSEKKALPDCYPSVPQF
ncbi:hypothetical protein DBR06_SOUSAS7010026, partial [Sousa chinensis]